MSKLEFFVAGFDLVPLIRRLRWRPLQVQSRLSGWWGGFEGSGQMGRVFARWRGLVLLLGLVLEELLVIRRALGLVQFLVPVRG